MKTRWKKIFLWSSLGGMAVGGVVALARKARGPEAAPLDYQKIPADCQTVRIWTEQFRDSADEAAPALQDKYVLRVTPFKVWSLLELNDPGAKGKAEGSAVYHVTHFRYEEKPGSDGYSDEGRLQDRFYGTIAVINTNGKRSARGCIARGGVLEIKKCLVGGAANGVETDETHCSSAPILNFRFEYISA